MNQKPEGGSRGGFPWQNKKKKRIKRENWYMLWRSMLSISSYLLLTYWNADVMAGAEAAILKHEMKVMY